MAPSSSHYKSSASIPLPNIAHLTEQDSLDKIDTEIAHFERHIQSLRQLRNTVVSIARLPVEIFSKVFLHCHQLDILGYNSRLRISSVSRHWRDVALGYPVLWANIRIFHDEAPSSPMVIDYVQSCLDRSQKVPLTIYYEGPRSHALSLCASQLSRIRRLHLGLESIDYSSDDHLQPLHDEWKSPAHLLTTLYIDGVDITDGLFGGVHPLLESVHISSCIHHWTLPLSNASTLTMLEITQPDVLTTPAILVSTLQNLPALESCTLDDCFEDPPQTPRPPPTTRETVHFPKLKYLSVEDDNFEDIAEFLERVDIPNASLNVLHHGRKVSKANFKKGLKWFKDYQDRKGWKNIHRIDVQDGSRVGCTGSFRTRVHVAARMFTFGIFGLSGSFSYDPIVVASPYLAFNTVKEATIVSVSIKGLKSFGPLPRLESLEVERMGVEFKQWARTASGAKKFFPAVTDLKLDGTPYPSFEDFLASKDVEVDRRASTTTSDGDSDGDSVYGDLEE